MSSEKITLRNVKFKVLSNLDGQVEGSMFFNDLLVLTFKGIGRKGMFDSITIINKDIASDMIEHLNSKGFADKLLDAETFVIEAFFIFESCRIIRKYAQVILEEHLEVQKELDYAGDTDLSKVFGIFIFETDSDLVPIIQKIKDYDVNKLDKLYTSKGYTEGYKAVYYLYYNAYNTLAMLDLTK